MSTRDGSPADGELHAGDVIVAVQGAPVRTTCDVAAAISRLEVGERVALTVRSEGEGDRATVVLRTARDATTGRSYIGVEMADVNYSFDPGVDVNFITGEIAGPSAGLMFTLALYDRLTPDDLTAGRTIAGTGTIDCGGRVGPIGGVAQKVAAAEANGADVFLAPALNALDAREAAGDIRVVSVSSFADAIDYLQSAV
jgi:PDZ domain-containing protein